MMRAVLVCVLLFACAAAALAETTVYVRNVRVAPPLAWSGKDVFVPRETILRLFANNLKEISVDAAGHVILNGSSSDLSPLDRNGVKYFPVLGTARKLGFEILPQPSVGIIDVASPRNVRLQNAQQGSLPLDPNEEATAKRLVRRLIERFGLCEDAALQARLERVGRQLTQVAGRSNISWHFYILQTRVLNAMSAGGGRIFVTRGLMERCDDAELAGAVAHEIAHDSLRHVSRGADTATLGNVYLQRARDARKRQRDILEAGGSASSSEFQAAVAEEKENLEKVQQVSHRMENWRTQDQWDEEREADRMGMFYCYNAGFNPLAILFCLEKLAKESPEAASAKIAGVSDHPPLQERIALARKIYETYFKNARPSGSR